jgi:multidrug efflux system membrane fusion protein
MDTRILSEHSEHSEQPTLGEQPPSSIHRKRPWLWLLFVVIVAGGVYFLWPKSSGPKSSGTSSKGAGGGRSQDRAIPVVGARATKGDIGVYLTGLGTVTPIYTVTVKSRVDGQLMEVHFKEGDLVHRGDPLLEIDTRPYAAQLMQAEGQLIKDQALIANAQVDLGRYQTLLTQNAVPEQQLATQKALVEQYEGAVKIDQGQINSAKLNLTYCHITAPIDGRIGLRLVDPGNIVHASDANGLLVITQIQPISVIFPLAEDNLPAVLKRTRAGVRLKVEAYDRASKEKLAAGSLATVDNQIDQSTGTVKLRATFDNGNIALFPNQFVNIQLLVEEKNGVTLLPTAALQLSGQRYYVWAVKADSTATVRQITIGTIEGNQAEITSGLSPGDVVVMTGVDKLLEGSKVTVQIEGENPQKRN